MLKQLDISNYALIENLSLTLSSDFTVITGETGAGKSIMLKALGLILGERADISIIKQNSNKCVLEAQFDISGLNLKGYFTENDIDFDEETLIRREFAASGKSRSFINDTPVQLSQLKSLGEKLINIHSQHQTLLINSAEFQFQILDQFAGVSQEVLSYQKAFTEYQSTVKEKIELQLKELQNRKDRDYLEFLSNELEEAQLDGVDTVELEKKNALIENSEKILENLQYAVSILENDDVGPKASLKALLEAFSNLAQFDKKYADIHSRILSMKIELDDVDNEIGGLISEVDMNTEESQIVKERLELVNSLCFKHSVNGLAELIEVKSDLSIKLAGIHDDSEKLEKLEALTKKLKIELEGDALNIRKKRKDTIPDLERKVKAKLSELAMENANLEIKLSDSTELNKNGLDSINYHFSANKGTPPSDLKKVASGGELSRLMLALLDINAELENLPTMIFDEIDTGVSGEVASKMAAVLRSMGKKMQVISITHLPQVAALGNEHIFVSKDADESTTRTSVNKLNKEERIVAIAKMLSGENITNIAKENAEILLSNH